METITLAPLSALKLVDLHGYGHPHVVPSAVTFALSIDSQARRSQRRVLPKVPNQLSCGLSELKGLFVCAVVHS
jgi:hypothetical protein